MIIFLFGGNETLLYMQLLLSMVFAVCYCLLGIINIKTELDSENPKKSEIRLGLVLIAIGLAFAILGWPIWIAVVSYGILWAIKVVVKGIGKLSN